MERPGPAREPVAGAAVDDLAAGIRIENGTVELVDESDGPGAAPSTVLRDVAVTIAPATSRGTPFRFEGTAAGRPLRAASSSPARSTATPAD